MIQRLLIIAAGIIRKLKLNRQIAVIADILQGLDYRGIKMCIRDSSGGVEVIPQMDEYYSVIQFLPEPCLLYTSRCV